MKLKVIENLDSRVFDLAENIFLKLLDSEKLEKAVKKGPKGMGEYLERTIALSQTVAFCAIAGIMEGFERKIKHMNEALIKDHQAEEEDETGE